MNRLFISHILFVSLGMYGHVLAWPWFSSTPEPTIAPPFTPPITFTLMIDPAGDARDTGREIDDTFERALTLQCAEELKKALESQIIGMRVVLTRFPGETVEPLQNAAFANRLNVDLYLSLHFFQTSTKKPQVYLYYPLYNRDTLWAKKTEDMKLLPYDQAYKTANKKVEDIATLLYDTLKKEQGKYSLEKPLGIPLKPVLGIKAPALSLEIGLKKRDDWKEFVPLLVTALQPYIEIHHGTTA